MSLTGQCLCGIVTYELKNPPVMTGVCHCKNCQRQAGSAFSTLAGVAKNDFVLNSGKMKIYKDSETDTGNTVERIFVLNAALQSTQPYLTLRTYCSLRQEQWMTPLLLAPSSTYGAAANKTGLD